MATTDDSKHADYERNDDIDGVSTMVFVGDTVELRDFVPEGRFKEAGNLHLYLLNTNLT